MGLSKKLREDILGFTPNAEQIAAVDSILEWAEQPLNVDPYHILGGFAGTGKSAMVKLIANELIGKNIALCAPTNKAVKVLKSLGAPADHMTIYSLLGLRMEQKEDELVLEKADRDKVGKYDLIVVDEGGMVNTELLKYIEGSTKFTPVKYLFVGDPYQLNPVGEDRSPIWGKYDTDVLRTVERHDNQILHFVTNVRSKKMSELIIESNNDGNEGVWYMTDREFNTKIKEYSINGEFSKRTKAIAWRNRTVDKLNLDIRKHIYGDRAYDQKWIVGDLVVFAAPHDVDDYNIVTDEEAIIKDIVVAPHTQHASLMCYYLTLGFDDGTTSIVKAIHENSEGDLAEQLANYANDARKSMPEYRKRKWSYYWDLKDSMAQLKHAYAITAHRSQGSTYENTFVDVNDILSNPNKKEAKRCFYVASSRPTTRLFLT